MSNTFTNIFAKKIITWGRGGQGKQEWEYEELWVVFTVLVVAY